MGTVTGTGWVREGDGGRDGPMGTAGLRGDPGFVLRPPAPGIPPHTTPRPLRTPGCPSPVPPPLSPRSRSPSPRSAAPAPVACPRAPGGAPGRRSPLPRSPPPWRDGPAQPRSPPARGGKGGSCEQPRPGRGTGPGPRRSGRRSRGRARPRPHPRPRAPPGPRETGDARPSGGLWDL